MSGEFLSKKRTAQALGELFGTPVSEGTVARMSARAAAGLDEFCTQIGDRIAEAEVAGFDETGLRVAEKLHWVHCARTSRYTLITCHPNAAVTGSTPPGSWAGSAGSPCTTPVPPTTPTPKPTTNSAVPMP